MTRWVVVLTCVPDASPADVERAVVRLSSLAADVQGVHASRAGLHLRGSVGGGDATWDVIADAHVEVTTLLDRAPFAVTDAVALAPIAGAVVETPAPVVKRTLLLRVRPETERDTVRRFEADLTAMPQHIRSIRSWALSRADAERHPTEWTHVWEQEYQTVDGLRVDYMSHPHHWTLVDGWFDPELPGSIVEPDLRHLFYESPTVVLTG
jgi:hypothetical protein